MKTKSDRTSKHNANFRAHDVADIRNDRSLRKRLIACLRMAHRYLGMSNKRLGLGIAAPGSRVVASSSFVRSAADRCACAIIQPPAKFALVTALAVLGLGAAGSTAHATEVACDPNSPNTTCTGGSFGGITDGSGYYSTVAGTGSSGGGHFAATVYGAYSSVTGDAATAIGMNASAAQGAIAIGSNQTADVSSGAPVGGAPTMANGINSIAFGSAANSLGQGDVAIGSGSFAQGTTTGAPNLGAVAIGAGSNVKNTLGGVTAGVAIGQNAQADGSSLTSASPVAIGYAATANGAGSQVAIGDRAVASGTDAIGIGGHAGATGVTASGNQSTAIGQTATSAGQSSLAIGNNVSAYNAGSLALGSAATAGVAGSPAILNDIAIGSNASATGGTSQAIGSGASATSFGGVALGSGSAANRAGLSGGAELFSQTIVSSTQGAVSVGAAGAERQIINVAGGTAPTDAVNVRQLSAVGGNLATALGGGAGFSGTTGAFTAPTYTVGGTNYNNVGSAINALGAGAGSTFVSDNTAGAAAPVATGANSSAGGYGASATGPGSTVVGNGATDNGQGGAVAVGNDASAGTSKSVAIGQGATTTAGGGVAAVAIGNAAVAQGDGAVALGLISNANGTGATAGGNHSSATGDSAVAFGDLATAAGTSSTSLGVGSKATGESAFAAGTGATATGASAFAMGTGSSASQDGAIAFGGGAASSAGNAVSIGSGANSSAANGVALGAGSTATRTGLAGAAENFSGTAVGSTQGAVSVGDVGAERQITNVAGGTQATDAVNVRQLSAVGTNLAGSLGGGAAFDPTTGAYTAPSFTTAAGTTATTVQAALGNETAAITSLGNGTATKLGGGVTYNPTTGQLVNGFTVNGTTYGDVASAISGAAANDGIVQRTATAGQVAVTAPGGTGTAPGAAQVVTNVAAGQVAAGSTQAVNGSQLYGTAASVASGLGGGAGVNADGTVSAPSYTVGGANYNNVGGAIGALDNGLANGQLGAFRSDNTAAAAAPVATGANSVAGGFGSSATAAASTVVGNGATDNGVANSTALGNGAAVTAGLTGSNVALGQGTIAGRGAETGYTGYGVGTQTSAGEVAVGSAAAPRTITGVSAGRLGTDAANVSQLNAVGGNLAGSLGGGAAFDATTGAYTAPAYTVGGQTYNNVGAALTAGNNLAVQYTPDATGAPTNAVDLTKGGTLAPVAVTGLANATTPTGAVTLAQMPLQYSTAAAPTTANPAVPSGDVTLVGATAGTAVGLHNVAAGTLSGTSTDAVNGSQLFGVSNNVNALGTTTAAAIGGGAGYTPGTGITGPNYTLNGAAAPFTNVVAGEQALANGAAGPVQYAVPGTPGNAVNLVGTGGPVTLGNVAPGTLAAGSTEAVNGGQLFTTNQNVTALTNGTAGLVQQSGPGAPITVGAGTDGTAVGFANNAGTARTLTGVAAGTVAAGSTQAVNGGQLAGTAASVATALGGGSTVNPDGTVSAPTYNVANGTYNNVGSALSALDNGINNGQLGAFRSDNTAGAAAPVATGPNSVAGGFGASATGAGSTVIGNGATDNGVANATVLGNGAAVTAGLAGSNVALGQGSIAGRGAETGYIGYGVGTTTSAGEVAIGSPAAPRTITGVAAGRLGTDAANVAQLQAVGSNLAGSLGGGAAFDPTTGAYTAPGYTVGGQTYNNVGAALAASGNLAVQYTPNATGAATNAIDLTKGGALAPVTMTGLAAGALTATSTDAVNGSQLFATNQQLAAIAGGTAGLVQQDPATRAITVGAGTDGTTVGFANNAGAARTLTGVAPGTVAAGSTEAVNGGQLYGTAGSVAAALGGGAAVNPDGTVSAPTYGVNGKSYASVGGAITALDSTGVKYDVDPTTGARGQSITLAGGDPNQPVVIHNVGTGTVRTDAANLGQVQDAEAAANQYTNQKVASIDNQLSGVNNSLANLESSVAETREEARSAAAIGLAAASLRYDDRPGKFSVAAGGGYWRGEAAGAFGIGYTLPDGHFRLNATAATAGNNVGVGAGASYTFN